MTTAKLPPPPVPAKLREMLSNHPEHLSQLQAGLSHYVLHPTRSTRFDGAIWLLDDQLMEFILKARDEMKAAQNSGDAEVIAQAKAKEAWMFNTRNRSGWMSRVEELSDYFVMHQDAFKGDAPPTLGKGLPPPPVPQRLQEMLKDYPGYLAKVQRSLNKVIEKPPYGTPPFEVAIWMLEGALETFIHEARDELQTAEASDDADAIERANEKLSLMFRVSSKGRWLGDSSFSDYFRVNREAFK